MRPRILSFFILMIAFRSFLVANVPTCSALPNAIEYLLNCFAEEQKNKNLVLVAKISDVDACCRITKLGFLFDLDGMVDIPAGRSLITGVVTNFLNTINSNEKLRPYLTTSYFTEKNVVIRIRIRNKNCGFFYPYLGNIAYISAMDGAIIYDTINSYTYDLDLLRMENFVEALQLSISK